MPLVPECPRCDEPFEGDPAQSRCPTHGVVVPLRRSRDPEYADFLTHLILAEPLPSWMPWPLPSGWQVTDFGAVAAENAAARACFVTVTGITELDGVVDVTVLVEDPGVGLGARMSGSIYTDPGPETLGGAAAAKIELDVGAVPMWLVAGEGGEVLDRACFVGESDGRWLWCVLRPAAAAMMLADLSAFRDVSEAGVDLLGLDFGSLPRAW